MKNICCLGMECRFLWLHIHLQQCPRRKENQLSGREFQGRPLFRCRRRRHYKKMERRTTVPMSETVTLSPWINPRADTWKQWHARGWRCWRCGVHLESIIWLYTEEQSAVTAHLSIWSEILRLKGTATQGLCFWMLHLKRQCSISTDYKFEDDVWPSCPCYLEHLVSRSQLRDPRQDDDV